MTQVLLTHGDSVLEAPPTCRVVGHSGELITALQHEEDPVFGVQFHPEVTLTVNGTAMFRNFLYKVRLTHVYTRVVFGSGCPLDLGVQRSVQYDQQASDVHRLHQKKCWRSQCSS